MKLAIYFDPESKQSELMDLRGQVAEAIAFASELFPDDQFLLFCAESDYKLCDRVCRKLGLTTSKSSKIESGECRLIRSSDREMRSLLTISTLEDAIRLARSRGWECEFLWGSYWRLYFPGTHDSFSVKLINSSNSAVEDLLETILNVGDYPERAKYTKEPDDLPRLRNIDDLMNIVRDRYPNWRWDHASSSDDQNRIIYKGKGKNGCIWIKNNASKTELREALISLHLYSWQDASIDEMSKAKSVLTNTVFEYSTMRLSHYC